MGYILPNITDKLGIKSPKIFIETGTYLGGVPQRIMSTYKRLVYKNIYTIELGEDQAEIAAWRYSMFEKHNFDTSKFNEHGIESLLFDVTKLFFGGALCLCKGSSLDMLPYILEGTRINEPALFWLDAHAGAAKYARGPEDVPLMQELDIILSHRNDHIIAIDDAHLFGTNQKGMCDYTDISLEKIQQKCLQANPNYIVKNISPYGHEMTVIYEYSK